MEYRILNIENRSGSKKLQANKLTPEHPVGFSALLTVLIIGVVALTMATSASLLGLGELELGYTYQKGGEAFSVADGCLEEAMRRLRLDAGYTGSPSFPVVNGSCTISVVDLGGNQRRLTILGQSGSYYKKIQAVITVVAQIPGSLNIVTINSWEERSD
ncbi:hypothetical protein A3H10_03600 [Candidatus Uhrbacteria bacterium RIFCSPLOWO2_12_FULL_46_10]|uniref:Type 4 fimbrial biogenesis protein PilX N-terminal domain-containing protein n=1 Tax=Candidatus Uhrbacteria bacterium RIFCSPLOWO2_01_FULL_47_25 TaxID=1802402 RepID=A0A1F7UV92_9BACT|nr:MAG: hypothetical protein UX68_C0011G0033 [Parcubacteria group bacterium GW2011_GWA2_46_9]OGL59072.1 MAG: hypothetical protein A2752_02555 [Candidatus Uhrbacteria bacterium RIFCSPHIGHO2_01_FULL_46_23]OGL68739.1 MAG: hypothetical protein A3D60_02160 [Candidatus Uhrbacteria bacterium RIFCSPHIGHO2_02_FULL_47_29]OGL74765.1 MAG: hypothetical protein A3E96_03445 [Candidatus Uhrbacteria bacterium RIFCSPHIGHO2_12_FULL_46_13]OGL82176.1 MAG: hypothetical protein A2936_01275 [Candidatus Uhrbacteria bac